ncbi:MAG: UDP-N-acetylmuramate dehydrogenase [Candidatus Omnitrophica bacterium]|nr:UDP-N-acetylmuramate dehydrogenase [Candidatus Omnitrophota bacterium]
MSLPVGSKVPGLKIPLRFDVPLSRYSTIQIGGNAKFFSEPKSIEELQGLLEFARESDLPILGIGKGSNILFPDDGFPGLVITFIHFEPNKIVIDQDRETVTASSGVSLYRLALASRDAGLGGAEFLSHIPGTVGGALVMNAGFSRFPGKKMEIGELVEEVTVLTPEGEIKNLSQGELEWDYRKTNLDGLIVLAGRLKLHRAPTEAVTKEIQESFSYRNRVQDLRYPSAGSVFKNPAGAQGSSGQLIEKVGLKGKKIGGAMISDKHANFIVNTGGARASDVLDLISLVQEKVLEAFGVHLEPEIRIIQNISIPK